jgi:methyl-accepting chemotaxis protein
LIADAKTAMDAGGSYRDTEFFKTIPVVVGWTAAGAAASKEDIDFRITAFDARNPENEPQQGGFQFQLLHDLESQLAGGGSDALSRINTQTNSLHYMRAVRLEQSCMTCHGDPAIYDAGGDGVDVVGFPMENWDVGDTHGAYEIIVPLAATDALVAGFVGNALMIVVPLGIAACVGLALLLRSLVIRPLRQLANVMEPIAAGDLTQSSGITRGDEIGVIAGSLDKLVGGIRGLIKDIASASESVAAAATEIAASNEEMSTSLDNQQRQTSGAASAVRELDQSVADIAQQSSEAAATAEQARGRATTGGDIVARTVEEITAIAGEVNESARLVTSLGVKSDQIGGVTSVINDIADQTNLLALNAAIEAARAGEHGRGFAVVADEVRKLAERTTQATDEVARSIREIQEQTTATASRIEGSTERMNEGVNLSRQAGDALREIVEGSNALMSKVQSIAAAAEEQAASAAQIGESVATVDSVASEAVQAAGQAAQAASELSDQSEKLRALVQRFKV